MVGFENRKQELAALDARVVAASVDPPDKAGEIAGQVSFPVAYGVTRADADRIGAWWGEPRNIVQPAEFVIGQDGKIVASTYSSGPVGRMDAADLVKLLNFYESRKG